MNSVLEELSREGEEYIFMVFSFLSDQEVIIISENPNFTRIANEYLKVKFAYRNPTLKEFFGNFRKISEKNIRMTYLNNLVSMIKMKKTRLENLPDLLGIKKRNLLGLKNDIDEDDENVGFVFNSNREHFLRILFELLWRDSDARLRIEESHRENRTKFFIFEKDNIYYRIGLRLRLENYQPINNGHLSNGVNFYRKIKKIDQLRIYNSAELPLDDSYGSERPEIDYEDLFLNATEISASIIENGIVISEWNELE